uniref:Thy-1 cell surface antigen n=1 Tax=Rousettus aegyptiacus TaxID=9407 RepID=A0A7J8H8L6_ROUAE|nr:Thy-1 cell surface antigen [Rousettus aegyptiacus]
MNPAIGITLLLTVLQVASGQKVTSLTACLVDQSLRLDCRHENTTTIPIHFTTKDEGVYTCELRLSSQHPPSYNKTVSVFRDKLVKCEGISLLTQNTSWLLLPLLSLPLLQAMDFISL